ncbi:MAG: hypothetical protein HYS33_10760 [Acidobacteria bacterium]|nr:hypothetical protein [Acidobacteriota bacterium]
MALTNHLRPPVEVVVIGETGDHRTLELLKAAYLAPRAGKRVFAFSPANVKAGDLPAGLVATLPHLPLDESPLASVCLGTACQPPVRTAEALVEALETK